MAMLRQALDSGAPPSLARLPMTPEEVAACYDEGYDTYRDHGHGGLLRLPATES
jgi:hypothetical protein